MNSIEPNQDLKKDIINKITINEDRNRKEKERIRECLSFKKDVNYISIPDISSYIKKLFSFLGGVGICYIVLFIVGCSNNKVGFMFNFFYVHY